MKCQASNVTANVQSDHLLHGYMLPVFFTTDQLYRASFRRLILDTREKNEKDENFVKFSQGLTHQISLKSVSFEIVI